MTLFPAGESVSGRQSGYNEARTSDEEVAEVPDLAVRIGHRFVLVLLQTERDDEHCVFIKVVNVEDVPSACRTSEVKSETRRHELRLGTGQERPDLEGQLTHTTEQVPLQSNPMR